MGAVWFASVVLSRVVVGFFPSLHSSIGSVGWARGGDNESIANQNVVLRAAPKGAHES